MDNGGPSIKYLPGINPGPRCRDAHFEIHWPRNIISQAKKLTISIIKLSKLVALVYTLPAAATRVNRPHGSNISISGPGQPGDLASFRASASQRAFLLLKDRLGPDAIFRLLQPDIDTASAFWRAVVANATAGAWVPATARVVEGPGLAAAAFTAWFGADTGDADNLLRGTRSTTRRLSAPTRPGGRWRTTSWRRGPGASRTSRYPCTVARIGPRARSCRRCRASPRSSRAGRCCRTARGPRSPSSTTHSATVPAPWGSRRSRRWWVRDSTPADVLEALKEQQAVEFAKWLSNAQKDIASGKFKVA